jgi:predicted nucleotidyltransferase
LEADQAAAAAHQGVSDKKRSPQTKRNQDKARLPNMKLLSNPIDLAKQAASDFKACYGSDLVSVTVYGSAAGRDFDPRTSDINLLVVLSSMTLSLLGKSAALQTKWMRKRFARPLFLDKEYIAGSLDSFPIEFLSMKDSYTVVFGEDVFGGLTINNSDLRLQIEREIKGKWLHLNRGWLESDNNSARLKRLLELSIKDFSPVFISMLHLKEVPIPRDRFSLFASIDATFGLGDAALQKALTTAKGGGKSEVLSVFPSYSNAIKSLAFAIDNLSTKENA